MAWRLAKSLETLRGQVNAAHPKRSKASDGTIGDAAHSSRASDHNPNSAGVVQAIDITHDPASGCDAAKLAGALVASKDARIKYIIWNKRIVASYATGGAMPWAWRPYTGSNPHDKHVHVSVSDDAAKYDDAKPWLIDAKPAAIPDPKPASTSSQRQRMGKAILDFEARRDGQGRLAVYSPGDGSYEVAGVNSAYHPEVAKELRALVEAGRHAEAEAKAIEYTLTYSSIAAEWTTDAGLEFYLRDSVFNRGRAGGAEILQRALGVAIDGAVGPATKAALAAVKPTDLLPKLRVAREAYEDAKYGARPGLRLGLVRRWDKALVLAKQFQAEILIRAEHGTAGAVVTGTATAVVKGAESGLSIGKLIAIAIVGAALAFGLYLAIQSRRRRRASA